MIRCDYSRVKDKLSILKTEEIAMLDGLVRLLPFEPQPRCQSLIRSLTLQNQRRILAAWPTFTPLPCTLYGLPPKVGNRAVGRKRSSEGIEICCGKTRKALAARSKPSRDGVCMAADAWQAIPVLALRSRAHFLCVPPYAMWLSGLYGRSCQLVDLPRSGQLAGPSEPND